MKHSSGRSGGGSSVRSARRSPDVIRDGYAVPARLAVRARRLVRRSGKLLTRLCNSRQRAAKPELTVAPKDQSFPYVPSPTLFLRVR